MRAIIVSRLAADPTQRGKLRALHALGVSVAAAVPERWAAGPDPSTRTAAWADDGGVRVVPIPVRGSPQEPDALRWSRRTLARLFTDFRPEVVQIEEPTGSAAAAQAAGLARRFGVPYVFTAGDVLPQPTPLGARIRRARVIGRAAGVLAASRLALELVQRHRADLRYTIVPLAGVTPPPTTERTPRAGLSIGFVGRLVPERGLDLLFRACVGVAGDWRLTVAGTGPAQEELEHLAQRLGIAARVRWLGGVPRQELGPVWPTLDCVALPARTTPRWIEPTAQPLVDAMAHGVVAVGSRSGVIPDAIGDAGLVVPEDDPAALGAALQRLLDDPAERARLAAEGRRRAIAEFADEAVARHTIAFWRSLAGNDPTTR